jgi:adenylate cyclase class IV
MRFGDGDNDVHLLLPDDNSSVQILLQHGYEEHARIEKSRST